MKMQKGFNLVGFLIGFVFSVVLLGGVVLGPVLSYSSVETTQIVVKEKERICEGSTNGTKCRYLVFTEQGVYENTDSLLQWKFDSSDVYNQLQPGEQYMVEVNWFRVPFLSWYQNILEIKQGGL